MIPKQKRNEKQISFISPGDSESYINGNIEIDQKLVVKEEIENTEECFKKALNLCTTLQNFKGKMLNGFLKSRI